jgi:L-threonylcarbamoyladenylate synthase
MQVFHIDRVSESDFGRILSILQDAGVIGFPTDTAYGLGADPFDAGAIDRLFSIKGRAETKPILLLVNSIAMAESVSRPVPAFYEVAAEFWPGPLTLVLPASDSLPSGVTAGTGTIGLRQPIAAFASELVERFGKPITATSANRSGMPSAVTADEVRAQLGDSMDALIDGGTLPARSGSTLLDLTVDPPVVIREGPVTFESLEQFFKGRLRRHVA